MTQEGKTNHYIRVFSAPSCAYCYTLKAFLDEHGFQYEDINVAEDPKAGEEMVQRSGQMGVPVIEIDGEIIVGFDRARICQLLGINE